jgi:broad specificity phosphatase PhoE
MNKILLLISFFCCLQAHSTETILLFRHGEKPEAGKGQLTCQGLQRALALPDVLIPKYGKPQELFAPNPSELKPDRGVLYAYIRPLATIEPTAIRLEMPVNLQYSLSNYEPLASYLLEPDMEEATFFIAWEHHQIDELAKLLVAPFNKGIAQTIPHWADNDFDSIYKITLEGQGTSRRVKFSIDKQGLNELAQTCPGVKN